MASEKPTHEYSAMLYALADEIRREEGCVTESPEAVEEAAERMDTLTVTIRGLEIQRNELLAALEAMTKRCAMDFCNYKPEFMPPESAFYLPLVEAANKAIASVKGGAA